MEQHQAKSNIRTRPFKPVLAITIALLTALFGLFDGPQSGPIERFIGPEMATIDQAIPPTTATVSLFDPAAAFRNILAGPQTAYADGGGNVDTVTGAGCMQDVYDAFGQGGSLNCTANDVSLSTATNIIILDDGCAFPGDTVSFTADFQVEVTAGARNDVGIYFSLDGDPNSDGALTGACTISTPAYDDDNDPSTTSASWLDLDGTTDNTTSSNDFGYCSTDGGATIAASEVTALRQP